MHLLVTDETNLNPSEQSRFFIYGGLAMPVAAIPALHSAVERIRRDAGLRPGDRLKFDTRSRPEHVSIQTYTEAKAKVIQACIDARVRFIAYMILHEIARNRTQDDLVEYGINTVLSIFNSKYLQDEQSAGLVLIDRLPTGRDYGYLKEKFAHGVSGDNWAFPLDRVHLLGVTSDGASHISSAVDIVLGAFRYCVNSPPGNAVAKEILPQVARLLYHRRVEEVLYVRDYGLALRPAEIKVAAYQDEYDALTRRLTEIVGDLPNVD